MVRPVPPVAAGGSLSAPALDADVAQLSSRQTLHLATGAAHLVAFVRWSGEVLLLREDVGRHNALDKLIGAMARARVDSDAGFELVTSRANYEMVHKTATAGITLLAAMSAPPAMAARIATQTGITLVGFAGRTRRLVRAHSQRVQPASR
jgi:FdhD protein